VNSAACPIVNLSALNYSPLQHVRLECVTAPSKVACFSLICLTLAACSQSKPKPAVKQYPLTGKIISVDLKERTAKIDAAAIPDYMGAMTMDYPIASDSDLGALKAGENISATVNVSPDDSYNLSNIHERAGK
jgi:Cu/Ag efflux protein CusF